MNSIIVTVKNRYLHGISEEFLCSAVDVSDLNEMEYCAEECCGAFLDMYESTFARECPDVEWDSFVEACYYSIKEA